MAPSAHVVVDLGFGDSGKGKIVDYLTRQLDAKLVVRFNGGAQAAHNVVTPEGLHHTFSQWGSGTLAAPDVATLLTSDVAIHPIAMLAEAEKLATIGVDQPMSRLIVDAQCLITTPYHQALNCMRELRRVDARHGSCGVGFGETVRMHREHGLQVRVEDVLSGTPVLLEKLQGIRQAVAEEVLGWRELPSIARHQFARRWYNLLFDSGSAERTAELFQVVLGQTWVADTDEVLARQKHPVIFEGAQGVLLDEVFGFAPHHTWSATTGKNATKHRHLFDRVDVLGVLRAYPTRHGAGPFPTEDADLTRMLSDPRNPPNPWQGTIRSGWFDPELFRYALLACDAELGPIDGLAITHLDDVARVGSWKSGDFSASMPGSVVTEIGKLAGTPVVIESHGPTSAETSP